MKKLYTKPEIMFESFLMSANIAAGCENINSNPTVDKCAYIIPGTEFSAEKHVFSANVGDACTTKNDNGKYDYLCYHTPTDTTNLFSSF